MAASPETDVAPFVAVVVDLASPEAGDRAYTYRVPAGWNPPAVGQRVRVPFGRRELVGTVVAHLAAADVAEVRQVSALLPEEPIPAVLLEAAQAVARDALCPLGAALRLVQPPGARSGARPRYITWVHLRQPTAPRSPAQAAVLDRLAQGPCPLAELRRISPAAVRTLLARGVLALERIEALRRPSVGVRASPQIRLTAEQSRAAERIAAALGCGPRAFLLHGVTGSGKTEVYLAALRAALARGQGAIVLVPEIALTPQVAARFRAEFGDRLALLHSGLPAGERYDEWRRLRRGEARVALGARSAVFAPVERLGLIVVDEEHEPSYKQEERPGYHAREIAAWRARREGAVLVLGSATPSLETYRRAEAGELELLRLAERPAGRTLPQAQVIDLRAGPEAGLLSSALAEAVAEALGRGEQAILFLNRRGFAPVVACRECGQVLRCPHCDVSLTFHRADRRLVCHYCGTLRPPPTRCPRCGSSRLRFLGGGTERLEEEVRRRFPTARVLRMDLDTTRTRGAHAALYDRFARRQADILIGTQMVAKGLDFPHVAVVGVVDADLPLAFPDFRASERTFQLITQVAGRAGRGERPGRVVVQTRNPEHYALQAALAHDYAAFYAAELPVRAGLGYPPFRELLRIGLAGPQEDEVRRVAEELARELAAGPAEVLGPAPAFVRRVKDRFRWHLLLRHPEREVLRETARDVLGRWRPPRRVQVVALPDPYGVL